MNITYAKSSQFPWLKGISKKRDCRVIETTKVIFSGVNWSGGSKSHYTAVNLITGATASPDMGRAHPWVNPFEGQECEIPEGFAIVEHGHFCGKEFKPYVYVRPGQLKLEEKPLELT